MSVKTLLHKPNLSRGFTIVELLIVIVVIGILATLTIVAYNGVTNRANTTSAQAAASTVAKKAEIYQTEEGSYPANLAALTSAAASETYAIPTGTVVLNDGIIGTAPTNPKTITFYACTGGVAVGYWDYNTNTFITAANTAYKVGTQTSCTAEEV